MAFAALHEYKPASCLLTGSKRNSAPHTVSFSSVILLCVSDGDDENVPSVNDALSGSEPLNHLMLGAGLASARHFRFKKLAESSGAAVSGCGLVSSRTSGESETAKRCCYARVDFPFAQLRVHKRAACSQVILDSLQ